MSGKKDRTVATPIATAQNYNQLNGTYQNCAPRSSENLKEQIGELLLHLQTPLSQQQRQKGWELFAPMLRRYVDLKTCGGTV